MDYGMAMDVCDRVLEIWVQGFAIGLVSAFVCGLVVRHGKKEVPAIVATPEPEACPVFPIRAIPTASKKARPVAAKAIASAATLVVPAPAKMGAQALRGKCQQMGIRWRNVHGKGKHLSVKEMKAAIACNEAANIGD